MQRETIASETMKTPAVASAVMHASVLAAVFLGPLEWFTRPLPPEPEPVMIEFEAIDKKAAAPRVGNPPPAPKEVPVAEEATAAPPPKTAEPPPAPPPPKPPEPRVVQPPPPPPIPQPQPAPAPTAEELIALKPKEPEPPKVEEKKPDPPKPEPEVKKPDPPKPPPPPPPAPPRPRTADTILDDILKNQQSQQRTPAPQPQPRPNPQQATRAPTAAPNLAAVVTASEVEGVRQKIRPCWNFPAGIKDQNALVVTLLVQMNRDGTPRSAEVRDTGRYNNDAGYRAAADAAHRAIMNPRCQPWPLPDAKYDNWRTITFNFDPRDY